MHLFDLKRQNLFSKVSPNVPLVSSIENYDNDFLQKRKQRWIDFFDEFSSSKVCFYAPTIEALTIVFDTNALITQQTDVEFNISINFYRGFLSLNREFHINSIIAAQKFLMLSLIFSKYPCLFNRLYLPFFLASKLSITASVIDELFCFLLIKYEPLSYIVNNFHLLNPDEIDVVILALNGKNHRFHHIFPSPPSRNEFSKLMLLDLNYNLSNNNILLRGLIYIKLLAANVQQDFTFSFVKTSKVFQLYPLEYYKNISFWKKALQLTHAGRTYFNFNLTDILDFLEYQLIATNNQYSLKGRTTDSLLRSVEAWHGRIFIENHAELRQLNWKRITSEYDLTFEYDNEIYRCIQLLSGEELFQEGNELKHCVVTYARLCKNYHCSIWSMQKKMNGNFVRIMTLEVNNQKKIVQARLFENALPDNLELGLLNDWATRMKYEIELYRNV